MSLAASVKQPPVWQTTPSLQGLEVYAGHYKEAGRTPRAKAKLSKLETGFMQKGSWLSHRGKGARGKKVRLANSKLQISKLPSSTSRTVSFHTFRIGHVRRGSAAGPADQRDKRCVGPK